MTTSKVLNEVVAERVRQEQKWGEQNHPPPFYLAILAEEFGEVAKSILDGDWDNYRTELIQVAAVAVAMVECFDRNKVSIPPPIPPKPKPKRICGGCAYWQSDSHRPGDVIPENFHGKCHHNPAQTPRREMDLACQHFE